MFHVRRSCILIVTLVIFVLVVILFRTNSLQVDILPLSVPILDEKLSKNEDDISGSLFNKIQFSKIRKAPSRFPRRNDTNKLNRPSSSETIGPIWEVKLQPIDTKLLEDDELRLGEISETDRVSQDVVIKYENGMFGLVDTDPTLHVWRASFPTIGQIWPHPISVVSAKHVFSLCTRPSAFIMKLRGIDNYIIQNAISRYKKLICDKKVSFYPTNWREQEYMLENAVAGEHLFKKQSEEDTMNHNIDWTSSLNAYYKGEVKHIDIIVKSSGYQWPSLYMNESYRLSVKANGIFIVAQETWGLLRALESVAQLTWRTRNGRLFINETTISDEPRFKHRGIMLDTARHFLPKEVLLKNLDAMEMNKFNVFHWHITDDQSFPLVTDHHPEFAKYGAYDPDTKIYRPDDVREIVEYARLRGVRVIPEVDSPSHTLSWRKSHPEVMTRCIDVNGRWSGHYGPLNMAGASTYRLLKSLFTDLVHMFPDQWVHLGSDEVPASCVLNNQAVQKWMQARGMYSVDLLTDFYMRKLQNIVTEIGLRDPRLQRGFIVWQEAYERNSALKNGTIVQLWKSQSTSEATTLARQGVPVIYSSCWYLDRLEYGAQWVSHYQCDPGEDMSSNMMMMNDYGAATGTNGNDQKWKDLILGGEAAMWIEFFDSDNVLPRMWPLACAAAERLWSPGSFTNIEAASSRLEEMRCRMMSRSIPIGVAGGAGDCGQPYEGATAHIDPLNINQYQNQPQNAPIYGERRIEISDSTSLALISQLLSNLFSHSALMLLLVIVALVIVLYLNVHGHWRLTTRRVLIALIAMLSLLTLVCIVYHQSQVL